MEKGEHVAQDVPQGYAGKENLSPSPAQPEQTPAHAMPKDLKLTPQEGSNMFFTPPVHARDSSHMFSHLHPREATPFMSARMSTLRARLDHGTFMHSPEVRAAEAHLAESSRKAERHETET
eukprot:scaffold72675_cov36-Prasinocladus_malaysianus.AAC.1